MPGDNIITHGQLFQPCLTDIGEHDESKEILLEWLIAGHQNKKIDFHQSCIVLASDLCQGLGWHAGSEVGDDALSTGTVLWPQQSLWFLNDYLVLVLWLLKVVSSPCPPH